MKLSEFVHIYNQMGNVSLVIYPPDFLLIPNYFLKNILMF